MKRTITAMTSAAILLTLCACGSAPAASQQTTSSEPTLSSITVTYDGSTDPGTEINDLANLKIEGQYSNGEAKAVEGCELLSPVTLKADTGSLVTVTCGDVTGDVVVTGGAQAGKTE